MAGRILEQEPGGGPARLDGLELLERLAAAAAVAEGAARRRTEDVLERRATEERGREDDVDALALDAHVAHDAHVDHGDDGDLGVLDVGERRPDLGLGDHSVHTNPCNTVLLAVALTTRPRGSSAEPS